MNRKRIVFMGTVAGTLVLAQSAFAAEIAAVPSQNALSVQTGETVEKAEAVPAYLYQGNNYFMLRDVGKIVGYQVNWDDAAKKISMTKDADARNMEGLSAAKEAKSMQKGSQTVFIDGEAYENRDCLNVDGYSYFKLRDLAEIMGFTCGWDSETNTILLTLEAESPAEADISVERFLNPDLKQQIIEEDVTYIPGSQDYGQIEKYMQENVDKDFRADAFIIKEDAYDKDALPGVIDLDMRLNVNGVRANDFGYRVTCINGKAALVMFIGEKNPAFDPTKVEPLLLTDEEAKQKAIEADGFDYKIEEQRVNRYFNMEELTNQCEVETVYEKDNGTSFATSHVF